MRFEKYDNAGAFADSALDILLEDEVQNNLLVSFAKTDSANTSSWFLATVRDNDGSIVLTAACTPPFNIVLYETGNKSNDAAVKLLSDELKNMGILLPGVLARQELAVRFASEYAKRTGYYRHTTMNIMRLDEITVSERSPGGCRPLREDDFYFIPYWERAFSEECNVEVYELKARAEQLRQRLGQDTFYIWEDNHPVSQAAQGRRTENGAVISSVYTPPFYRNKGYASSLVTELSHMLLDRGAKFCCLFADANNPISCGIYRKIGFYDLCIYDEIKFSKSAPLLYNR